MKAKNPKPGPSIPARSNLAADHQRWRPHAPSILLLWTFLLLAYSNSFRTGLVFDNRPAILQDTRVQAATAENVRAILGGDYWYRTSSSGLYRPFTKLSYLVDYAVLGQGPKPAGYHWVNFALHAVNATLVYLLGLVLFRDRPKRMVMAIAFALVWSLHPVLTESVTNVIGRADLLAGLGILGGLLCHIQAKAASGWCKAAWLGSLALLAAIGSFSKESGVMVIVVVLVYDLTFEGVRAWRSGMSSYVAATLPIAAFLVARQRVLGGLPELVGSFYDNPLLYSDFFTARLTAVKVLGEYVWLLLWPGRLSCDYSYNQVPVATWTLSGREDWKTVAAVATCLAAIALAVVCYRRRKTVCFLIAMAFVCIAPTANLAILIGTIMAERFLYLPAIGFAGCVVLGMYGLCGRLQTRPYAAPAILGVLCSAYAVRTYVRNFDWMNEGSLWVSAASASPNSYKPHRALITWFATTNGVDRKQAVREAELALAILDPLSDERSSAETYAIAGGMYRLRGDEADPAGNPAAWYDKALRTLQRGQKVDLANTHEIVLRNRERGKTVTLAGYAPLYLELGRTYLRLGDPQHAVEALEYGRSVRPDPDFSDELANAYRAMDNPRRSAVALMEGLMLDPGEVAFASKLVALYKEAEPDGCAVTGTAGGASINLGCPLVHDQLCTAAQAVFRLQTRTGRWQEAARTVQSAIREMGCPAEAFR